MLEEISRLEMAYESRVEAPFVVGSLVAIPPENPLTGGFEVMQMFPNEDGEIVAALFNPDGRRICVVGLEDLVDCLKDALKRFAK